MVCTRPGSCVFCTSRCCCLVQRVSHRSASVAIVLFMQSCCCRLSLSVQSVRFVKNIAWCPKGVVLVLSVQVIVVVSFNMLRVEVLA